MFGIEPTPQEEEFKNSFIAFICSYEKLMQSFDCDSEILVDKHMEHLIKYYVVHDASNSTINNMTLFGVKFKVAKSGWDYC